MMGLDRFRESRSKNDYVIKIVFYKSLTNNFKSNGLCLCSSLYSLKSLLKLNSNPFPYDF